MAMDFSWLPPGQDVRRLPMGMRVNNPGNIKYNPKLGYEGMLGPSAHTDQGDAQMTFDTPQSGMNAMARLVRTKYKRGQTTPMSIIAGQGGWTPGNSQAAANVARTMGIDPNADLGLDDPERMVKFLKALTLQEHGASSTLYGDDLYSKAATANGGGSVPYMTQALNAAGAIPGATPAPKAQPVAGTTGTLPGLPDFGPLPSDRRKRLAEALASQAFKTAGSATNPLGALAAMAQAYASTRMGGEYDEQNASRNRKLAEALASAPDNDAMMRTMFASGDDDMIKAATSAKVAAAKGSDPSLVEIYDEQGRKQKVLMNPRTGAYKLVGGARAAGDGAEGGLYNKNLVFGEDAEGNPVPMQAGSHGEVVRSKLPEGVKLAKEAVRLDAGTHFVLLDPTTRQVIGQVPKDVAGKEAQEEVGKQAGQAQTALPAAKTMVDNARKTIAELRAHPGLNTGTGATNIFDPRSWIPGTDAYDFQAKNKQATGQSFMAARDALKGAGQVTDFEGQKGEQAIANLDAAQSKEQYLAALDNLEAMLRASYLDLERKAKAGKTAPPAADPDKPTPVKTFRFNPQTGEIE